MSVVARVILALLVLSAGSGCGALRSTPGRASIHGGPIRHVLPNGTRVVVQEHRAADVVALQLWVRAGARDEGAGELGLAHYLEHMVFKGTSRRPPGFVEREVEAVGGRMNAGTAQDYTYYHALLPAGHARAGIELMADIGHNASLDPTLLEQEKQVVLEEMRLSEDNPRRHLHRLLYGTIFDGHPYGRPVIGTSDLIRGLTRETLLAFYRRTYVPEAFTLVVVGAVEPSQALAAATRAFGRVPRSGLRSLPPAAPPPAARVRRAVIERPGSHAYLGMAWLGPRLDHADTAALELLVSVLGQGRSSRLVRSLRERQGIVNTVSTGYAALEAGGALTVTAQLPARELPRVEQEILVEIGRLRQQGITEAERRRAVTAAEARHASAMETAEGRAYLWGRAETLWTLDDELAHLGRLHSVTTEQVRAAARRYLDPERYGRLAFVPPRP